MARFQNTVAIGKPAEEVFVFLADFQNVPRWNYAIEKTWQTSPGSTGVGATYRQIRTIPHRSEEGFEVTVFEPPTGLAIHGQIGPFQGTMNYLLEPVADGTWLTNSVELAPMNAVPRLAAPLVVPRVKTAVAANLHKLKQLIEDSRG